MAALNFIDECIECDILLGQYESATFDLARLQNALETAERLRDGESIRRLTRAMDDTAHRQKSAGAILKRHRRGHLSPGTAAAPRASEAHFWPSPAQSDPGGYRDAEPGGL